MGHPYPVYLSLEDCGCLVVGLGSVGTRKLAAVLAAGIADALVLELRPRDALTAQAQSLLLDPRVKFEQRPWQPVDLRGRFIVFACSGDKAVNRLVAASCRQLGVLCNCATAPGEGNFIIPAVARAGDMSVALSTSGQSPLLARRWRKELETWLQPRQRLACLMGRLRPAIIAMNWPTERNRELFGILAQPELEDLLTEPILLRQWLRVRLPESLYPQLDQILTEIAHVFS